MNDTNVNDMIETQVPSRLDRLPWSRFHWMVVIAEGRAKRLPRGQFAPA